MAGKIFFVPHGGGPLPVLGDAAHEGLTSFLTSLQPELAACEAIVMITAHWEAESFTLSAKQKPGMLYDYYGFPQDAYELTYAAPGADALASEVHQIIEAASLPCVLDHGRDYDHGTYIPLMLMRPQADIPVLQVSLQKSLDPAAHIAFGRALAGLLDRNIALVGSGMSFHNLGVLLSRLEVVPGADVAFDDWLNETLIEPSLTQQAREERLVAWADAPNAQYCHPREEHLLPLHVCAGAGFEAGWTGQNIFQQRLMGCQTSGFKWEP